MKLVCMECGHKFNSNSPDPRCPRCRSVDLEPRYEEYYPTQVLHKLRLTALEGGR